MSSKADILASLRADIAVLEARPSAETPSSAHVGRVGHIGRTRCAGKTDAPNYEETAFGTRPRRSSDEAFEGASRDDEGGKTAQDAYQKILRWAAVRERSTAYLRERLLKDGFSPAAVEEALQRALRVRAVDDRRYADALVRMKLAAGRGLRDAEREIEDLGIDPATLDSWIEHEQKGRDFEIDRALAALRRRPPQAKRAREAAFRRLVSQGFSTDIAATASRAWSEERERAL